MDTQNPQRVVRALEVCLASRQALFEFSFKLNRSAPFDTLVIGLKRERAELIDRINRRVDSDDGNGIASRGGSPAPSLVSQCTANSGYREWDAFFQANGQRTTLPRRSSSERGNLPNAR